MDDFKELYEHFENKRGIRKVKVKAREIYKKFWIERFSTGRIYKVNANEFQNHSAFNIPVYNSNLCLAGDTKVQTKEGTKELKDIKIGDYVLSYNVETCEKEFKKVTNSALMSKSAEVIEIEITDESGNTIICTPDHKIFTKNRGYVEARNLKETDEILR